MEKEYKKSKSRIEVEEYIQGIDLLPDHYTRLFPDETEYQKYKDLRILYKNMKDARKKHYNVMLAIKHIDIVDNVVYLQENFGRWYKDKDSIEKIVESARNWLKLNEPTLTDQYYITQSHKILKYYRERDTHNPEDLFDFNKL